jgi:hypothetical protein
MCDARFAPDVLDGAPDAVALVHFLVVFLGNPRLVRNAYQRAKLVEVVAGATPAQQAPHRPPSAFFSLLMTDPLATAVLPRSLMQFYDGACLLSFACPRRLYAMCKHQMPKIRTFTRG